MPKRNIHKAQNANVIFLLSQAATCRAASKAGDRAQSNGSCSPCSVLQMIDERVPAVIKLSSEFQIRRGLPCLAIQIMIRIGRTRSRITSHGRSRRRLTTSWSTWFLRGCSAHAFTRTRFLLSVFVYPSPPPPFGFMNAKMPWFVWGVLRSLPEHHFSSLHLPFCYFCDFKFSKYVCPSELYPLTRLLFKTLSEKKTPENPSVTPP